MGREEKCIPRVWGCAWATQVVPRHVRALSRGEGLMRRPSEGLMRRRFDGRVRLRENALLDLLSAFRLNR